MDDVQAVAGGAQPGGIFELLVLIEEHRGPLEYDWRTRFHLPLSAVGDSMSFGEALRLVKILRRDTTSQLAVAMEGWDFPADRTMLAVLDLFDLTVQANTDRKSGKPKPHSGRPFKIEDRDQQRFGNTGGRSRSEVVEILNRLGHSLPV